MLHITIHVLIIFVVGCQRRRTTEHHVLSKVPLQLILRCHLRCNVRCLFGDERRNLASSWYWVSLRLALLLCLVACYAHSTYCRLMSIILGLLRDLALLQSRNIPADVKVLSWWGTSNHLYELTLRLLLTLSALWVLSNLIFLGILIFWLRLRNKLDLWLWESSGSTIFTFSLILQN